MAQNYAKNKTDRAFLLEALQWHLDNGMDELLSDQPVDRTAMPDLPLRTEKVADSAPKIQATAKPANVIGFRDQATAQQDIGEDMMGTAQAIVEAKKLAQACRTLEELSKAISGFDGISIRKNATNMVFSDGNPKACVMLIGEAPGADEDAQGKPFVGVSGHLLDRILACIDLSREAEEVSKAVYISNILNWRPPGNRTPTQAEMEISLPFIERHIALVRPKAIILCGGVSAKSLLRNTESISRLRGKFHDYQIPEDLNGGKTGVIPAMATYHPAYLLRTPAQKKAVWADMLMFREKLKEF